MNTYQVTFNPSGYVPKQITKTYENVTLETAQRYASLYASLIKSTVAKIIQL